MQQEASRKLGFTLKKTMAVAQGLYEGVKIPERGTVGLITYMRTDSTRISEEAREVAKQEIVKQYGEEYYENRYYKTISRFTRCTRSNKTNIYRCKSRRYKRIFK